VNERPCIRCQHPVLLEDGHLVYCRHCGAPQIFLSEELQSEIAQTAKDYEQRHTAETAAAAAPEAPPARWGLRRDRGRAGTAQTWSIAVHYALLSAAVALVLGLLSILLPPVGALMLLWVLGAPILTVTFFSSRTRAAAPGTSGFAARLGLLTAVLVGASCAVVFTASLLIKRYMLHDAALFDAQLAASFAQQRELALQRLGTSVQPTLDMLNIPEFRVGLMLGGATLFGLFYLFLSTVAAGVTGLFVRRRPTE
jgi:hypothetical protein